MAKATGGYIQQLPSGSFRVSVYAGTDPLTGRQIRLRKTCKTERAAQIELGRLLEQAAAGRQPETDATVAQLMDRYAEIADWDLSTRKANEVYIRRVIKPALGHLQVRKIRGPLLDLLYAQLRRCSDSGCTGKRFVEHRNVPLLAVDPGSRRPAWQQVVEAIGAAIRSGMLTAGEPLPSVREMSALQDVPVATLQHALAVLADERLVVLRQGRTAVVAGDAVADRRSGRAPRGRDHDCKRAGCQPHVCKPMTAKTIRNVHSILSGAFATAKRWEWITWNPAESAKPPAVTRRPLPATTPEDVAKVIAEGRKAHPVLALYLWLVAITGGRRGELCALQVRDVDLVNGVLHIAFNYVVVGGQRVRKDTKTHQDRYLAIDPVTCAMISEHLDAVRAELAAVGLELPDDAYVFSNDPMGARPWNPDWATHKASDLAAAAGVKLNIKGLRHYTASQLLAARFDLRNTAARLGHGSGGATTLRHYADPVSEVDRRAAAYLAQLTAGSVAFSPDSKILATGDTNSNTYLWNPVTHNLVATLPSLGSGHVRSVAFNSGGKILAVSHNNGWVYLWNPVTHKFITTLKNPGSGQAESVMFSPDSTVLAAGDSNGRTYLWNPVTHKFITSLLDPGSGGAGSVAFNPDSKTLDAGDNNGKIYLWNLHKIVVTGSRHR